MKNSQVDFDSSILGLGNQRQTIVLAEEEAFCPYQKPSVEVCINKKCNVNPFVCAESKCPCIAQHEKCTKTSTLELIHRIKKRNVSLDSIDDLIDEIVQNMIDYLSDFRDKISLKLKQDFTQLELDKVQKQFLEKIEKKQTSSITSKQVQRIFQFEEKKQKIILENINKSKNSIQMRFNEVSASLLQSFDLVTEDIELLKKRLQSTSPQNKINTNLISLSKFGSKIVKTQLQDNTLSSFFNTMQIDSIKLFYRASQNDFSIKKFHELCDGVPNTLVLIETEYGKKIGAYTPIQWKNKGKPMNDETMSSFLFSLTNGDKFTLSNDKDPAVYHNSVHGPVFGKGNDLFISDKANVYSISHANINFSYVNEKYQFNDDETWLKFIGNVSSRFKIIEWEVWGLLLD